MTGVTGVSSGPTGPTVTFTVVAGASVVSLHSHTGQHSLSLIGIGVQKNSYPSGITHSSSAQMTFPNSHWQRLQELFVGTSSKC